MDADDQTIDELAPFYFLLYEERHAGQAVSVARSIATGHVSIGTTQEHALRCLVGTIKGSIRVARAQGLGIGEWLDAQQPDAPEYIVQYAKAAAEEGEHVIEFDDDRITTVTAA